MRAEPGRDGHCRPCGGRAHELGGVAVANLKLDIRVENLDKVRKALDMLSGPQARVAYAKAINDTAYKVRREMQADMGRSFALASGTPVGKPPSRPRHTRAATTGAAICAAPSCSSC